MVEINDPLTGRNEIRRLIWEFGKFPAELRKTLRPRIRNAVDPALADARKRARWSARIPDALRASVSFTRRSAGASIIADRRKAPHARPWEGIRGNGVFRHPVYGRDKWVAQKTRPFMGPAVEAHALRIVAEVNKAVDDAARASGFRE